MESREKPQLQFNLIAVGDPDCGKESLLDAVASPGECETSFTVVKINNNQVVLFLYTISCLEDHAVIHRQYYGNVDVVLLCFSINNPKSLCNIERVWMPEVQKFCPEAPVVMVGNRMDLRNDQATIQLLAKSNEEPVKTETGNSVAEKIGAYYTECSVLNDEGVKRPFVIAALASVKASTQKVMDISNSMKPCLPMSSPNDYLETCSSVYDLSSESLEKYMAVKGDEEDLSSDLLEPLEEGYLPSEYWDDIISGPSNKHDTVTSNTQVLNSGLTSLCTAMETLDIPLPVVDIESD